MLHWPVVETVDVSRRPLDRWQKVPISKTTLIPIGARVSKAFVETITPVITCVQTHYRVSDMVTPRKTSLTGTCKNVIIIGRSDDDIQHVLFIIH